MATKDLEPDIKEQVVPLCEKGLEQQENERYEASNRSFQKVLGLIPEPKNEWKAYTWLLLHIADNHYELKEYEAALDVILEVLAQKDDYSENAYVKMRLGQCLYETGAKKEGLAALVEAYEIDGEELFEDEYVKYLKLVR